MRTISFLLLIFFSQAGLASTALLEFSNSMYSFTADFTQTVYDSDSTVLQENKGQVKLVRPGKFRWVYSEPFEQVIVADGVSLWVYDKDIAQVTVRPQAETLGSAPIGLLSGQRAIQSEFDIVYLGDRDNLQWFQLDPLVKDTDFQRVFIAVDDGGLRAMELRDSFEQATQIRFSNFRKNVNIASDEFVFTPPEGADVVGETGVAIEAVEESAVVDQPEQVAEKPLPEPLPENEQTVPSPAENEQSEEVIEDDELLGGDDGEAPAGTEATSPEQTDVNASPADPEDVLREVEETELNETPDNAPGTADAETTETTQPATGERKSFFEVVDTPNEQTE